MTIIFATLSGVIHVYIFFLESILWGKPKTNKVFKQTPETAEITKSFAYNQGWYNLFLAIGTIGGVVLNLMGKHTVIADTMIAYANLSMLAAAIVLITSNKELYRAALIQGLAPLLALIGMLI
jgi:putative membrane protein